MTRIGVKSRSIRNLYVLVVHAPGSRGRVLTRSVARRPWLPLEPGARLRDGRRKLRVTEIETRVVRNGDVIEHVTEVYTRGRRIPLPPNVVRMPAPDLSVVAQFIRFHVLVRVYHGDPDAWLAQLPPHADEGDVRFIRWMRARLRDDPKLLEDISAMVDTTRFWSAASG